ncbi:gamma-glutamyl-gamma-aminobutyrate hydrolase family protein [Curvibacter sp. AEP1-3]|uniref:gamma-glutamyl-gamma-aminobutyrate hydrolase family protein n=1 Tax=Curvibacter sp. AEP1-3 TaxID=1844971 RepID=UPI00214FD793|nr:gamma-glutamyl-gamma-aminobutyrate hydrolase family protein [Curvibacter sp. AEP1-3]
MKQALKIKGCTMYNNTYPIEESLPADAPRVLITCCNRMVNDHPFHMVGRKYVEAVRLAGAYPIAVPAAHPDEVDTWLDMVDGVFLTGSASNLHPSYFGEALLDSSKPLDPVRDSWTLPLIRRAVARGIPLLGVCRGFQETNVALGGSLHQAVHDQPGNANHREANHPDLDVQYGPSHRVQVTHDGHLAAIVKSGAFMVNSLHGQGIARLASGLRVEARAEDGLVEAFTVGQSPGFALCVQWHPEWKSRTNASSMAILRAFGDACRQWRATHRAQ